MLIRSFPIERDRVFDAEVGVEMTDQIVSEFGSSFSEVSRRPPDDGRLFDFQLGRAQQSFDYICHRRAVVPVRPRKNPHQFAEHDQTYPAWSL